MKIYHFLLTDMNSDTMTDGIIHWDEWNADTDITEEELNATTEQLNILLNDPATNLSIMNWEDLRSTNEDRETKTKRDYVQLGEEINNDSVEYRKHTEMLKENILKKIRKSTNLSNSNNFEARFSELHVDSYHYILCPDPLGRLGNGMFQFAATLGIGNMFKFKPLIKPFHPLNKLFDIHVRYISEIELNNLMTIYEDQWNNVAWRKNEEYLSHNLTILGFFQSWKLFEGIEDEIRKAFSFKVFYLMKAYSFLRTVIEESKTLIGVHVRRGDFLNPIEQWAGRVVASRQYIEKALYFFRQRHKNAQFIVCSDDMGWSKENVLGSDVIYSPFTEEFIDMAIMSMCDHMIITVGTFGWWGGWLSGGTVVYLQDFPRPGSFLHKDPNFKEKYYPPHWIGMTNKGDEI